MATESYRNTKHKAAKNIEDRTQRVSLLQKVECFTAERWEGTETTAETNH